jgi:hypothetical protein
MEKLRQLFVQLFFPIQKSDTVPSSPRGFFDYSSAEKMKLLRAAGREAQKEQQQLLKAYEARFGQAR